MQPFSTYQGETILLVAGSVVLLHRCTIETQSISFEINLHIALPLIYVFRYIDNDSDEAGIGTSVSLKCYHFRTGLPQVCL